MRYTYRKTYQWDSDIAYLVGLITADGCLINDSRHINITSKDTDLLETVREILSLQTKIKPKKNGFGGIGYYLQFSNVSLYDFLLKVGLTPAKSKTIKEITLPSIFYADFLRGVFDGDGTVYGFWDKRWKSSFMFYVEITSASKPFLVWLHRQNAKLVHVKGGKIKKSTRAFKLAYAKQDSRRIFEAMYRDGSKPALVRKKDKFIDFLRTDPYSDKAMLGEWRNW